MALPWSNRFDYDYNRPNYGRGPAPWQSEAPRARHVGGRMVFEPTNSGSQRHFGAEWPGDRETSLPRTDAFIGQIRSFAGQYLGTRLALGKTDKELHNIEEDVHALRTGDPPLPAPSDMRKVVPPLGASDAFGPAFGTSRTKRRDAFGVVPPEFGTTVGEPYGPSRADMLRQAPPAQLALGAAPSAIPLGPGPQPSRPKMGTYGDIEAGDARLAGGRPASAPLYYGNPQGAAPRRTTGGNDRRLKGLINRQLNDRM